MERELMRKELKRVRKQQVYKNKLIIGVVFAVIILLSGIVFTSIFSAAMDSREHNPVEFKYYKMVEVSKGDSLWSIAEKYQYNDNMSINDFVEELMVLNNMSDDKIYANDELVIAYTDTEFRL